jgi:hypothetical protein
MKSPDNIAIKIFVGDKNFINFFTQIKVKTKYKTNPTREERCIPPISPSIVLLNGAMIMLTAVDSININKSRLL